MTEVSLAQGRSQGFENRATTKYFLSAPFSILVKSRKGVWGSSVLSPLNGVWGGSPDAHEFGAFQTKKEAFGALYMATFWKYLKTVTLKHFICNSTNSLVNFSGQHSVWKSAYSHRWQMCVLLQNSQIYGSVGNSVCYEWQEPDGVT